jgi:DNA transformation protein and related proteins
MMTDPADTSPVSSLRNLGPATEAAFAKAGIHSAEQLRALGADQAYLRLLQSGTSPHFIGYYVLVMALQDRPWNDCKGAEKAELRRRFDALKVQGHDKGRSELEAALNFLGVIAPKSPAKKP